MKIFMIAFLILAGSLTSVYAVTYECFEVELDSVLGDRGARIPNGRTLEVKFRSSDKVKLTYVELGEKTKFVGRIVTRAQIGLDSDDLGWIDSEMYTLVLSPRYYLETLSGKGLMMGQFHAHGGLEVTMFCNFMQERDRW